jgi:hypothetical protein
MDSVTNYKIEDFLNHYWIHWTTHGTIPSVAKVARDFNLNPITVQSMVDSVAFRKKLVIRGVPLSERSVLSPEQFRCIAIVTDPTVKGGLKNRLKIAGIGYSTYQAWMRIPEFKDAVNILATEILENSLSDVNTGLVEAASRGDVSAVKFYYEVTGKYNPADRQVMDVMSVLAQVVEIIQKHVSSPEQLKAIAADLSMLSTVAGLPGQGRIIQATDEPLGVTG